MKPCKIVRIVWRDIASVTDKWSSKDEILLESQSAYDTERATYGEVIHETQEYIVIASTVSSIETYHDTSMIMKSVIIRTDILHSKPRVRGTKK